jgi:hypothetical protein
MKDGLRIIFEFLAIVIIVMLGLAAYEFKRDRDFYKNKIENDFKQKYLLLERQLRDSERERLDLVHHYDSLVLRNTTIGSSLDSIKKVQKNYKSPHKTKTIKELEESMEKGWQRKEN